jgi:hypothetical protein
VHNSDDNICRGATNICVDTFVICYELMMPSHKKLFLLLGSFYLFGAFQLEVIISSTILSCWGFKQNEL